MDAEDEAPVRVVDGYRRDVRRKLVAALVPGGLAAGLGALLLFFGVQPLYEREPARAFYGRATFQLYEAPGPSHYMTSDERGLVGSGALLCLLSPFILGFGLRRLLVIEDFLILRTDGLVHQHGGRARLFLWDEVDDVRWDPGRNAMALVMCDGAEFLIHERYAGATPEELVRRIRDCRRKAMWRLLPAQR